MRYHLGHEMHSTGTDSLVLSNKAFEEPGEKACNEARACLALQACKTRKTTATIDTSTPMLSMKVLAKRNPNARCVYGLHLDEKVCSTV
jgi:hypothetical protein